MNSKTDETYEFVIETEPLSRLTLALYCGASGDHYPLHVDTDWVKANTNFADVIGHGMLTMAYLGRLLTQYYRPEEIVQLSTRFLASSHVGDRIICKGRVVDSFKSDEGINNILEISAESHKGELLATGRATVKQTP